MGPAAAFEVTQQSRQDAGRDHLDLQKSLEVMRFVIMRENQKLKDLVQQAHEQLVEVKKELDCEAFMEQPPCPATLLPVAQLHAAPSSATEPLNLRSAWDESAWEAAV